MFIVSRSMCVRELICWFAVLSLADVLDMTILSPRRDAPELSAYIEVK